MCWEKSTRIWLIQIRQIGSWKIKTHESIRTGNPMSVLVGKWVIYCSTDLLKKTYLRMLLKRIRFWLKYRSHIRLNWPGQFVNPDLLVTNSQRIEQGLRTTPKSHSTNVPSTVTSDPAAKPLGGSYRAAKGMPIPLRTSTSTLKKKCSSFTPLREWRTIPSG